MQLSTRGRYAVMAMVDLATQEAADSASSRICLADIACRQQLSQSYLEQLFAKLRRAELVCSARGPGGGYRLARPSSEIAIADIVAAVDEPITATRCEIGSGGCMVAPPPGLGGERCQTHDLWFELGRQIAFFLSGITLADVVLGRVMGRAVRLSPAGSDQNGAG
ncbi:MAG: Rrf2 family transcriptional regulator [Rhodopila sp.]|nr:Rrf2 family transcriptional regulator [Rhodopila sp.]